MLYNDNNNLAVLSLFFHSRTYTAGTKVIGECYYENNNNILWVTSERDVGGDECGKMFTNSNGASLAKDFVYPSYPRLSRSTIYNI